MVQGLRQIERIAHGGEPRMGRIRLPAEEAPFVPLHGRDVHRVDAVHQFPGNRNPVPALYRRGQTQQPFCRSQTALPLLPRLLGRRPGRIGRSQLPLTARLRAGMTLGNLTSPQVVKGAFLKKTSLVQCPDIGRQILAIPAGIGPMRVCQHARQVPPAMLGRGIEMRSTIVNICAGNGFGQKTALMGDKNVFYPGKGLIENMVNPILDVK